MSHNAAADLERGWTLPFDSVPIQWTTHAREQFFSRTGLDADEMSRSILSVSTTAPDWAKRKQRQNPAFAWAAGQVGGVQIALPLYVDRLHGDSQLIAGTTLTNERQEQALRAMARGYYVAPMGPRKRQEPRDSAGRADERELCAALVDLAGESLILA